MRVRQVGIGMLAVVLGVAMLFGALCSVSRADYTTISVQPVTLSGLSPTYSSTVSGGFQFVNDGRVMLDVFNTNAAVRYITITTPVQVDGLAVADVYATVPATTGHVILGPFATGTFNNAGGYVYVSNSATAGLTMAAIKLP